MYWMQIQQGTIVKKMGDECGRILEQHFAKKVTKFHNQSLIRKNIQVTDYWVAVGSHLYKRHEKSSLQSL